MTLKLIKREIAKRDIIELADYIARDSLEAAEQFIVAVVAAFRFLTQTPGAGARRDYLDPSLTGLRIWPVRGFEKHLVFYRETVEGLEIVRVLHATRDIEALFRSEDEP
ncbi:MAG: type II toxin-antitoxin system RelE/ParE family toxin [Candidatus Hydrogenedentes bacterium]|nr:type II toxin-antitoxin system RelE/ParE family toxin [Candidatus Hydrogenedentota bacterium]